MRVSGCLALVLAFVCLCILLGIVALAVDAGSMLSAIGGPLASPIP